MNQRIKICPGCGNQLPMLAQFCNRCGQEQREQWGQPSIPVPEEKKKTNKMLLWGVVALLCTTLIAVAAFLLLGNPVQRMVNALECGDGAKANNIYMEEIYGDFSRMNKAKEEYRTFLQEILTDYEEEKLTYEEAQTKLTAAYNLSLDPELNYSVSAQVDALHSARQNSEAGDEAYENGDYLDAIHSYEEALIQSTDPTEIAEVSDKLEDARSSYVTEILDEAKRLMEDENYAGATEILENAYWNMPDSIEIENELLLVRTTVFEKTLTEYIESGDISQAIEYYQYTQTDGTINISADITAAYSEAIVNYRKQIMEDAGKMVEGSDYNAALLLVEDALTVLVDDAELSAYLAQLESDYADYQRRTTPVNLAELTPYNCESVYGFSETVEDIFGTTYDTYIKFASSEAYATYRVDGIYATFTGTIFVPADHDVKSRKVSIYGDGKLLFEVDVNGGEDSTQFSVDITGIRDLTIKNVGKAQGYSTLLGEAILTP